MADREAWWRAQRARASAHDCGLQVGEAPRGAEPTEVGSPHGRSGLRPLRFVLLGFGVALTAVVVHEARTSYGQAELFARISSAFGYEVRPGRSERIRFPSGGPFDKRLGYDRIPLLTGRLDSLGFEVTHQARLTSAMARWVDRGLYPIYREKARTGLRVDDRRGVPLVDERFPLFAYADFDSVPELLWRTLVYIETQSMLDAGPRRNPAVEWDRLAFSATNLALRELGADRSVPGGSTLATQLEKFRHSPGGMTSTPSDKIRQMLTASLRAYSDGPDTYEQRRRILVDYLNSVPLAGQAGHGEVVGIGEGLWVWYGTPFAEANQLLRHEPTSALERVERARIYRQALSLLVAQRRPTGYLTSAAGHEPLASLTDAYLRLLERDGIISEELAHDARRVGADSPLSSAPHGGRPAPPTDKGASSVRAHLLGLTRTASVYELDRLDLAVESTLDGAWSAAASQLLDQLRDESFLASNGFKQQGILGSGDPSRVFYSVLLMERTELGNAVRLQADNFPGDLRLVDGSRLELGSTAKLRTLVTYLEIVEELHGRLAAMERDSLPTYTRVPFDPLTRWAARRLAERPETTASELLTAAMQRRYSASPRERFQTGGSELTFSNFDNRFDESVMTVEEAFRHSVNLPFIRLMRDVVEYEVAQLRSTALLAAGDSAWRRDYLVRFAEHEGAQFIRRFHRRYRERAGHEVFETLLAGRGLSEAQVAWAVRAIAPDASLETFSDLVRTHSAQPLLTEKRLTDLYERSEPGKLPLSDLGYLSRVHPLELWVAAQRLHRPTATLQEILVDGRDVSIEVYGWLLKTSRVRAQETRIRAMLEIEAFQRIHARWRRLGYPFDDLTPSLGTAIGSSGDRPLALAELAGLLLNDGVALPTIRVESLRFAEGTPFETRMRLRPQPGERRLTPEVAAVVKTALFDVVEAGTGRRARGAVKGEDGEPLRIGGKTGTGDNRHRVYDDRGRLRASLVMNRTATFVFITDDRYFGVVTAHVEGPEAAQYRFTSALPAQLLSVLGPRLEPHVQSRTGIEGDVPRVDDTRLAVAGARGADADPCSAEAGCGRGVATAGQ